MIRILLCSVMGIALLIPVEFAQSGSQSPAPSDSEIHRMLVDRLGQRSGTAGIVVGIIEPAGTRIIAYGSRDRNDPRPVDGNTVFEIGSITKVFTSLILADMVRHGEVALTDPVARYLPQGVRIPERGGRAITLEDLARHRSGLPRMPANFDPNTDPQNPYIKYSVNQLYEFLSGYVLPRDIDSRFEYSNMGAGLLGHALSLKAGKDYETLVRTRIWRPLGMEDTAITLPPDMKSRLAVGHNNLFQSTSNWDFQDAFAGAGAIRSTANDMLRFLAAQLGYEQASLTPAISETIAVRKEAGAGMEIGLGWLIRQKSGSEIIWHNGGTGGYRAFAGYDPKARVGVVALTNISTPAGVDDLGFHLLDPDSKLLPPDSPLLQPPWESRETTLDAATLDLYAGKYQMQSVGMVAVIRENNRLFVQMSGQPRVEIFAESDRNFFCKAENARITFESEGKKPATALILHQGGKDYRATRIAE